MHKIGKDSDRGKGRTAVRVHCFPEISPVRKEASDNNGGRALSEALFQRFDFAAKCRQSAEAPGGEDFEAQKRRIEEQAYRKGFSDGRQKGLESGKQELAPVLQNFRQALQELEKVKLEIYRSAERESVDLALAIARKVVCREVSTSREAIVGVVREAFRQAADQDRIRIRLCPADLQLIDDPKRAFSGVARDGARILVEGDDSISSGGCVIETEMGDIDARIERQLQVIEEALRAEMPQTADGKGAG